MTEGRPLVKGGWRRSRLGDCSALLCEAGTAEHYERPRHLPPNRIHGGGASSQAPLAKRSGGYGARSVSGGIERAYKRGRHSAPEALLWRADKRRRGGRGAKAPTRNSRAPQGEARRRHLMNCPQGVGAIMAPCSTGSNRGHSNRRGIPHRTVSFPQGSRRYHIRECHAHGNGKRSTG